MSYFIKQLGDKDCGFTCVKMLLSIYYHNKDYLYYPLPNIESRSSLRELMHFAKKEEMILAASRVVEKEEILKFKSKKPFLAPINKDNNLHMVLIRKVFKRKLLIYDPSIGIYFLSKKEFLKIWNGEILEVSKIGISNFKTKKIKIIPKYKLITTLIFQIFSFTCLVLAMLFVDKNFNFLIPLFLFLGYILFEILYQKTIISSLKFFDNEILTNDYVYKRINFQKYFEPMNRFKYSIISYPIQIISCLLILSFGIFVLAINNLGNLIILGITFILQIAFFLFEKLKFRRKLNYLEVLEKRLTNYSNENVDDFKINMTKLNEETYKCVSYYNFKKYLLIFVTIILCLIYQGFIGEISLNFMLFHFFIYIYLQENFDKILNVNKIINDIKYYKCLYLYYFH